MNGFATSSILASRLAILLTASTIIASPTAFAAGKPVQFANTKDGKPLQIKPEYFDTEQSRKFLESGKNPHIGDKAAIDRGKKVFQLYSCTQCRGGSTQDQTGPGLTGPNFKYAKNTTDPNNGMSPDEILKLIAWVRSQGEGAK